MLRPLKLSVPDHKTFMVSDLHIGHNRDFIYEKRDFRSVEEHDNTLVHRWNEVCDADSHVFHLGDIIFADPDGSKLLTLLRRLSFDTIYLLWGNHQSGQKALYLKTLAAYFPDAVDAGQIVYEVYPLTMVLDDGLKRIVFLPAYAEVYVGKQAAVLCHYPVLSHNGLAKQSWMICGHSHSGLPLTNKDTGKGFRLDVGIESFGRPISVSDIRRHLAGRDIDSPDHHGKDAETS